jgi:hypothetical protein
LHLKDLIGKNVIRIANHDDDSNYKYNDFKERPIFIWYADDQYAVYKFVDGYQTDEKRILQQDILDDNWIECEWLLNMATKDNLDFINKMQNITNDNLTVITLDKTEANALNFVLDSAKLYMEYAKDEFKKDLSVDVHPVIEWIDGLKERMDENKITHPIFSANYINSIVH